MIRIDILIAVILLTGAAFVGGRMSRISQAKENIVAIVTETYQLGVDNTKNFLVEKGLLSQEEADRVVADVSVKVKERI